MLRARTSLSPQRGEGMRVRGGPSERWRISQSLTTFPPLTPALPMNLKVGRRCPQRAVVPCQPPSWDSSSSPGALRTAPPYQRRRVQGFTARSSVRRILSPSRGEGGSCLVALSFLPVSIRSENELRLSLTVTHSAHTIVLAILLKGV